MTPQVRGEQRKVASAVIGGVFGVISARLAASWWGLTGAVMLLAVEMAVMIIVAIVWNAVKQKRILRGGPSH